MSQYAYCYHGEIEGHPLSPAERRCLTGYARLGTQKLVAQALGVSPWTVKNNLYVAYQKLGVTTAIEAFVALGWLRVPDEAAPAELRVAA